MTLKDPVPPSDLKGPNAVGALRRRADAIAQQYLTQSAQNREILSPENARLALHELRVHQIELEMQNEELRRAQVALNTERMIYFDLYDLAPVGYCTLNEQGLILKVNLTAAAQLVMPRAAMLNQPISRFIFKEDQDIFYLQRKTLLTSGQATTIELRLTKSDGSTFWVQLTASTTESPDGTRLVLLLLDNIDARKKVELQLQISDAALKATALGVLITDTRQIILSANAAYTAITGYSEAEIVGQTCLFMQGPLTDPTTRKLIHQTIQAHQTFEGEILNYHKDGSPFWNELTISPVRDAQGNLSHFIGITRDITSRKRTEQQLVVNLASLHESALNTQTVLHNMVDGAITINPQGLIASFNKAASLMFGYTAAEVIERHVSLLIPESQRSQSEHYLQLLPTTGESPLFNQPRDLEGRHQDGHVFPLRLSVSRIIRGGQAVLIGIARDLTQHRRDKEKIHTLAYYDTLTGLPNRRLLMDRLQQRLASSAQTRQHGALLLLDLDHFKRINDALGHGVGDLLLQQVASRLKACVRESDSVARLNGDEFVLLLGTLSQSAPEAAAQAEVVANKVLLMLSQAYNLTGLGHNCAITPSIGITLFVGEQESRDDLLKKADVAMYQAKAAGRNTARFFDPAMQAAVDALAQLEKDMRRDLALEQFVVFYQIQVDSQGAAIGAEALVRWQHERLGLLTPEHFIPLAEESGLILILGQWVLETACAQLVVWAQRPETATWTLAVNVSAHQFAQPDFVDKVVGALEKSGASPHLLKLELTESMLLNDVDDVIAKMNLIKAYGVGFALDDFGTGFSSLSYLKRLPLDQLKIDKSFVQDLLSNPNDAVIARTVVALGHSLGLKIMAEGVETIEQRDFLNGLGCDTFQGYYFSHPLPASELTRFSTSLSNQAVTGSLLILTPDKKST
jgi:diguanylate cyclase (GGDEF)-like protein/PAS domain S-box-containing protein